MSQLQRAMQGFRSDLVSRIPRIKKGAYLTEVRVGGVQRGQFSITGLWKNKDGTTGSYSKVFGQADVFSHIGPRGFRLVKRQCRHADDFIREVLRIRGVIT